MASLNGKKYLPCEHREYVTSIASNIRGRGLVDANGSNMLDGTTDEMSSGILIAEPISLCPTKAANLPLKISRRIMPVPIASSIAIRDEIVVVCRIVLMFEFLVDRI